MCAGEKGHGTCENGNGKEHHNIGIHTLMNNSTRIALLPDHNDTKRKLIGPLLEMLDLNLKPS